eukprot:GHVP01068479.1.p1 GENE.GHVP01068479.1~~GHVP01068479.1.p1  ORF type:complete len:401 (+),score=52.26 GHVP01068479.1:36-1238(+)
MLSNFISGRRSAFLASRLFNKFTTRALNFRRYQSSFRDNVSPLTSTVCLKRKETLHGAPKEMIQRSERGQNYDPGNTGVVFAGNGNKPFAELICQHLGTKLGKATVGKFADGEIKIQFDESIRGKNVYVIQPTSPPVSDNIFELLLMVATLRRASANAITAVVPYYGYARQDRKLSSRIPIAASDISTMLSEMGIDRLILVDVHSGQLQGFFPPGIPVDNLESYVLGMNYFNTKDLKGPLVLGPDVGGVNRARKFLDGMYRRGLTEAKLGLMTRERTDGGSSGIQFVGDANGLDCIIVDDMIDTGCTLAAATQELKKHGAQKIYAFATHGVFSGDSVKKLTAAPIDEIVVTDTIPLTEDVANCTKIKRLGVSTLVAEVIRRIHGKESIDGLFEKPFRGPE